MEGHPPHMVSALMHQPVLARKLDHIYRVVWGQGVVPNRVKEVARLRSARVVDCGACRNVRLDGPIGDGLTEDVVDHITDDFESSERLTPREKAALLLTDAIAGDPRSLDSDAARTIREQFTEEEIAELSFEVAKLGAVAKLIITMGMEPERPRPGKVIPAPRAAYGLLTQEALEASAR